MNFDPARHFIVCVDRQTGEHFHLSMPDFSAAEAQYEFQAQQFTPPEATYIQQAVENPFDAQPLHDRITALEGALASALLHVEKLVAREPAPAESFIQPEKWPVEAAEVVVPVPPPILRAKRPAAEASLADAMRAVEAWEQDIDAPLPEYVPPPGQQEAIAATPEPVISDRSRLIRAAENARGKLTRDSQLHDLACRAVNGHHKARARLEGRAKRAGFTVEDFAENIIAEFDACEEAISKVTDIEGSALDGMEANPADSASIVDQAIEEIEQRVRHAAAN